MTCTNVNGLFLPELSAKKAPDHPLGKYGRMRCKYLREYHPVAFDEMLLNGTLHEHLYQTEQNILFQISQTMKALSKSAPPPDRRTDPLGWTQHMNALHAQAEEAALELLYE